MLRAQASWKSGTGNEKATQMRGFFLFNPALLKRG